MLVKLKDIVTFINGRAYSQPELQDKGKYRIVRVGNFSGKNEWFYSDMELNEDKYCENGDLLYKWACNFGPEIWKSEKTIFHYHIWKIKWDEKRVDKMFLYYLLMYMTPYWLSSTNGSIMIHITKETMEEKIVDLPPLKTQKKISKILENLDKQIEKNLHIVKRLQVMGQAIFDMFLNNAKDYENIESLCKIIWGQCPKGNNILSENVSNNLMLYASGAGDLENNKILISPKAFTDKPIKIIDNRTICMSIAGTVGKIGISDKNIAIGRAMVGFYNEKKFGLIYFILNKYSSF
ncbi:type I restriction-modification system subunit S (plasmid) [Mycoplasmopsis fermentans]|nr:type I restriction-modification system subunit S [Mycoplasmopsis fermentans]